MLAGNATLTQMGFAISFGIAISAFLMAMFLTPALTALIGHAAWWPGHGDTADHDEPEIADPRSPVGSTV
jgi:RND superfamily putative drug exporter